EMPALLQVRTVLSPDLDNAPQPGKVDLLPRRVKAGVLFSIHPDRGEPALARRAQSQLHRGRRQPRRQADRRRDLRDLSGLVALSLVPSLALSTALSIAVPVAVPDRRPDRE